MTPADIIHRLVTGEPRKVASETIQIVEGGARVLVSSPEPPPPLFTMTTAAVESRIDVLGACRANMVPAVSAEWRRGETVTAQRDPAVCIETDALAGDVILHVRDPRFGWLHYVIGRDRAHELGQTIFNAADAPAPAMRGRA